MRWLCCRHAMQRQRRCGKAAKARPQLTQLRNLAANLTEGGVAHKLWIEQPEDFATCLATHPAAKSTVAAHFKKLKLCKGT